MTKELFEEWDGLFTDADPDEIHARVLAWCYAFERHVLAKGASRDITIARRQFIEEKWGGLYIEYKLAAPHDRWMLIRRPYSPESPMPLWEAKVWAKMALAKFSQPSSASHSQSPSPLSTEPGR